MDITNYDFVKVSIDIYFRVHNSKLWGGEDGYMKLDMQNAKNTSNLPDDFLDKLKKTAADTAGVTLEDIDFITEKEYIEATEDDDFMTAMHVENNWYQVSSSNTSRVRNEICFDTGRGFIKTFAAKAGIGVTFKPNGAEDEVYLGFFAPCRDDGEQTVNPDNVTGIKSYIYGNPKSQKYADIFVRRIDSMTNTENSVDEPAQ